MGLAVPSGVPMKVSGWSRTTFGVVLALGLWTAAAPAPPPPRTVCVAQVKGTIWPATASYLARALGEAAGRVPSAW